MEKPPIPDYSGERKKQSASARGNLARAAAFAAVLNATPAWADDQVVEHIDQPDETTQLAERISGPELPTVLTVGESHNTPPSEEGEALSTDQVVSSILDDDFPIREKIDRISYLDFQELSGEQLIELAQVVADSPEQLGSLGSKFFSVFEVWKDEPESEEITKQIFESWAGEGRYAFDRLVYWHILESEYATTDWARALFRSETLTENAAEALEKIFADDVPPQDKIYASEFLDWDYVQPEAIVKAANLFFSDNEIALSHSGIWMNTYSRWKHFPEAEEIVRRTFALWNQDPEKDSSSLVVYHDILFDYEGTPWVTEAMINSLSADPARYFKDHERYNKFVPFEPKNSRFQQWATKAPDAAIDLYKTFAGNKEELVYIFYAALLKVHPAKASAVVKEQWNTIPENSQEAFRGLEQKAVTQLAVLAQNLDPRFDSLLSDEVLFIIEKIPRAELYPLAPEIDEADERYWQVLLAHYKEQVISHHSELSAEGLATMSMKQLQIYSEQHEGRDPVALEQAATMVARYLHWRGEEVTIESVQKAVTAILERRETLKNDRWFSDNVTVLAHGQAVKGDMAHARKGESRFAPDTFIHALKEAAPQGKTVERLRPRAEDGLIDYNEALQAKKEFLERLETDLEARTIVVTAHGSKEALYLSDGEVPNTEVDSKQVLETNRTVKITVEELSDALATRFKNRRQADATVTETNISIIFSACFMNDFIQNVAVSLKKQGIPLPQKMVSASEYGQYGFTDYHSPYLGRFEEALIKYPTVGEIIEHEGTIKNSNPSVFVPDPEDPQELIQISGVVSVDEFMSVA